MNRMLIVLAATILSGSAAAQVDATDEAEEIRRYTVEVIVFSYLEDVGTGSEIFPGDKPAADEASAITPDADPADDVAAPAAEEAPAPTLREIEFERLRRDELTLGDTYAELDRLDVYEPVMHFGWTQPTYPPAETPAIRLRALGRPPEGLDGSFTLYLSRYLHLVVDLALDAPADAMTPDVAEVPVINYGDARAQNTADYSALTGPVRYRIREDRIFRSGELRYFDHPKFGVLAKVTRAADDTDALLAPAGQ